eukprot:gnl/Dysnectes_brevis/1477_a1671_1922.p1 GENE.gnl/Dysnectes_brevis/1477_a1671_1922~~gnl/Dysnectes_brevis/1477_a1671_1922.p1  ORF type:complete len:367 (-),score=126.29 gnl/Dysnectes_brevis/1477_a1671_1922:53-1126(-)
MTDSGSGFGASGTGVFGSFGGSGGITGGATGAATQFGGQVGMASQAQFTASGGDMDDQVSEQIIVPVTAAQLFHAQSQMSSADRDFKLDQRVVRSVTVVGMIISSDTDGSKVTFKLDDGTGGSFLQITHYIQGTEASPISPGSFVWVFGKIRVEEGAVSLMSLRVRPITDYNQLTYHGLAVIRAHVQALRGDAQRADPTSPQRPAMQATPYQAQSHTFQPADQFTAKPEAGISGQAQFGQGQAPFGQGQGAFAGGSGTFGGGTFGGFQQQGQYQQQQTPVVNSAPSYPSTGGGASQASAMVKMAFMMGGKPELTLHEIHLPLTNVGLSPQQIEAYIRSMQASGELVSVNGSTWALKK